MPNKGSVRILVDRAIEFEVKPQANQDLNNARPCRAKGATTVRGIKLEVLLNRNK